MSIGHAYHCPAPVTSHGTFVNGRGKRSGMGACEEHAEEARRARELIWSGEHEWPGGMNPRRQRAMSESTRFRTQTYRLARDHRQIRPNL